MSKDHVIHYTIDGEPQETTSRDQTPRQILIRAGLKPEERYLVQIEGRHQESYQNRMDEVIHMHEHQKFVSVFVGPVPVS